LGKFIDKGGNWKEYIQRVEEDILKVAVSYSVQEGDTEEGKLRVDREREWVEWTVA